MEIRRIWNLAYKMHPAVNIMKTRLLFLLSLATLMGTAQANPQLLYYYDFEQISGTGSGDAIAVNHNLASKPGTGSWVEHDSSLWVGWVKGGALNSGYAYNAPSGGSKLTLTGTGENGSLGVNTTDGFTLSFHIKDTGAALWANLFQLNTSAGNKITTSKVTGSTSQAGASQFLLNGNNGLGQQNWADFTAPMDGFMHLAFTFQNGTLLGYKDGVQFLTANGLDFTGELTSVNLAPGYGAAFDEVQLWSGILNQSEIAYLATHQMLPEPATATLGALGLAFLALRRKRKQPAAVC